MIDLDELQHTAIDHHITLPIDTALALIKGVKVLALVKEHVREYGSLDHGPIWDQVDEALEPFQAQT